MKLKMIALALPVLLAGCAADLQPATAPMGNIVEVINFPNVKQETLFNNSKIWIAKEFTSANNVIQYADKEQGSIVGKGNVKYPCHGDTDCMVTADYVYKFTMKIDTKDNKARISFTDLTLYEPAKVIAGSTRPASENPLVSIRAQERAKEALASVIADYKAGVLSESAEATNW